MASSTSLKITNRSSKKPIKKLPTSIDVNEKTTVQDVKVQLAKQAGGIDPERLGLFDPEKKKILKDRNAVVNQLKEVMAGKEILVKDLGLQISWKTVFIIEYLGPILIHLFVPLLLRPYIYSSAPPLSTSQYLSMAMIVVHFLKREYETACVHRFSLSTMPAFNIFKNSAHYWLLAGLNIAYWVYAPNSYTALEGPSINYINAVGLILYVFGQISNFHTHQTLANLRSPGGTERGIPKGYGFGLVTCPNYMFELISWTGIMLVTKSLSTVLFNVVGGYTMYLWSMKKEKALRAEFPDKYKKKKYVLIPSPGAVIKYITG